MEVYQSNKSPSYSPDMFSFDYVIIYVNLKLDFVI